MCSERGPTQKKTKLDTDSNEADFVGVNILNCHFGGQNACTHTLRPDWLAHVCAFFLGYRGGLFSGP